jgi:hypothetical protein
MGWYSWMPGHYCFAWKAAVSETASYFPDGVAREHRDRAVYGVNAVVGSSRLNASILRQFLHPAGQMQAVKGRKVGRATRRVLPIFSAFAWQLIQRG